MLSEYGEKINPRIQERKEDYCFDLEEQTERRDLLVETMKEEKARLEKKLKELIVQSIEIHAFLQEETKKIEAEIREILDKKAGKDTFEDIERLRNAFFMLSSPRNFASVRKILVNFTSMIRLSYCFYEEISKGARK